MSQQPKRFHFLISGSISFIDTTSEESAKRVNHLSLNGVLIQDKQGIPVKSLAKAQQVLQLNFFKQVGDEGANLQIVAVILNNLVFLGEFTEEEWNQQPAEVSSEVVIPSLGEEAAPTPPSTGKDNPFASGDVVLPGGGEVKPEEVQHQSV